MPRLAVRTKKSTDRSLIVLIFSLLAFGLIIIANSTSVSSNKVYGDPYRFMYLQLGWILIGLVGFFVFYKFPLERLSKLSVILGGVTLLFLTFIALVSLLPCSTNFVFVPCVNGANRWFYFNPPPLPKLPILGVLGFQPSELAKLTLIIFLATYIEKLIKDGKKPFMFYMSVTGLVAGLVFLQPNMSTAVMIFMLGTVMYFASGASVKPFVYVAPIMLVLALLFMLTSPYRRERVMTLIKGESDLESTSDYHLRQVLIALGSGGPVGVGFGQSRQKYQYLPEVASDSIFAIIGEEFGFIGTSAVILIFSYLIYKGILIAKKAPDIKSRLMAVGITSWIGIQFFVNIAAMSKIIPLTGVPIPLISYGGSSMLFSLMGLGILANINKNL